MSIDHAELDEFRKSLAADGYRLNVDVTGEAAAVSVVATPEACDDCLVSKDLMRAMLAPALGVDADAIKLNYPTDLKEA